MFLNFIIMKASTDKTFRSEKYIKTPFKNINKHFILNPNTVPQGYIFLLNQACLSTILRKRYDDRNDQKSKVMPCFCESFCDAFSWETKTL